VNVVSIGHFTIDSVTFADGTYADDLFGGDGVYAAVGAAIWGAKVQAVSVVGRDFPRSWLKRLDAARIGTAGVRRLTSRHRLVAPMVYDRWFRRQNERGEPNPATQMLSRAAQARRWAMFSPKVEDAVKFLRWADAVHIAGMPIERQNAFLRLFQSSPQLVTVDLPWPPRLYSPGTLPQVDLASAVLLSDAEMKGIFPGLSPTGVWKSLSLRGARVVAIKRGSKGSTVFETGQRYGTRVAAYPTRVLDPTGAGDAYCGGFLVGLAETSNPQTAGLYGAVSASFVIEGLGAETSLGSSRFDAERRLAALKEMSLKDHG